MPGRVIVLKLALEGNLLCVLSDYTPHSGLTVEDKTIFCDYLLATSVGMKIVVPFLHAVTSMEISEPMKLVMKAYIDIMGLAT